MSVVDRLNIVAHDRFQEIIDEANRADSPIRLRSYSGPGHRSPEDSNDSGFIED